MAAWLQELSGLRVTASDKVELQAQLKSGVVLCQAANRMGAGIICGISQDDEMENIEKFVKFLRMAGVSRTKLFVATDLHANKNMEQVMITLNDLTVTQKAQQEAADLGALIRNLQSVFAAAAEKGQKEGATTPSEKQVHVRRVVLSCIPNAAELKRI